MNNFIKKLPEKPTFRQSGLNGFKYPLKNQVLEIVVEDSEIGHDGEVFSEKHTHIYYILEGTGKFIINMQEFEVSKGQLVEIPPRNTFTFKGEMRLLLVMEPPHE